MAKEKKGFFSTVTDVVTTPVRWAASALGSVVGTLAPEIGDAVAEAAPEAAVGTARAAARVADAGVSLITGDTTEAAERLGHAAEEEAAGLARAGTSLVPGALGAADIVGMGPKSFAERAVRSGAEYIRQ